MFASDKLQIAKGPDCENAKGPKVLMETVNVRGVFVIDTLVLFAFRNERVKLQKCFGFKFAKGILEIFRIRSCARLTRSRRLITIFVYYRFFFFSVV